MAVQIDTTAQIDAVRLREQAGDPAAPAASHWLLYAKAAGLFIEDSSSVVTGPFGAGGGGTDVPTLALTLLNDSAGTVNQGDVVFLGDFVDMSFDIDSDAGVGSHGANFMIGVVLDATILSGATGKVAFMGYVSKVNLASSASLGNFLYANGSASQGTPLGFPDDGAIGPLGGAFGQALEAGTTPKAFIWNPPVKPVEQKIVTIAGIDLSTGTPFVAYTVPGSLSLVVTRVVARNANASLGTALWSMGYNATSYDDVIGNAAHTELTGSTVYTVIPAKNGAALGAATTTLQFKVNVTQAAATMDIDIYGYFI